MDPVFLSRIQFAVSIGVHYLFPLSTIGLALFILLFEASYVIRGNVLHRRISTFLVRVMAPMFVMGVATGLLMPFSFGTNWAQFSRIMGEVFGPFLAIESTFAFSLESVFLAVLLFGRSRVGKKAYLLCAFLVFFGTHLSGLIIVAASSWMQTPAGYEIINNRVVLKDFAAAFFNPSMPNRFMHTILGAWITGAVVISALGAWYLLKDKTSEPAREMVSVSLVLLVIMMCVELFIGHSHILDVVKYQPAKAAAFEGTFRTQRNAPSYIFGIPDAAHDTIRAGISVPGLLSYMIGGRTDTEVAGLDQTPPENRPPVNIVFPSFHIMVGTGFVMLGAGVLGLLLMLRKKLYISRWYLALLIALVPAPFLVNQAGWVCTEVGRQPWIVYELLKTAQAASVNVPAVQILGTLIALSVVYLLLLIAFGLVLSRVLRSGIPSVGGK